MFHICYINASSIEEMGWHGDSEECMEKLRSALETLKTLPVGAKIEIRYAEVIDPQDIERPSDQELADDYYSESRSWFDE